MSENRNYFNMKKSFKYLQIIDSMPEIMVINFYDYNKRHGNHTALTFLRRNPLLLPIQFRKSPERVIFGMGLNF